MTRALVALIIGVMLGAAVAAVRADEPPVREPRPIGAARPEITARVSSERIVTRVADPAGGPEWAVKLVQSQRMRNGRNIGKPQTCVQLGRIRGGEFGWIHSDGSFRAGESIEHLEQCMPRTWRQPMAQFISTLAVSDPAGRGSPAASSGAGAGGVGGHGERDRRRRRTGLGHRRCLPPRRRPGGENAPRSLRAGRGPRGTARDRADLRAHAHVVPARHPWDRAHRGAHAGPGWRTELRHPRRRHPRGRALRRPATRIVDGRAGAVQLGFGLFWETVAYDSLCRPLSEKLTRKLPCTYSAGFGGGAQEEDDAFLRRARVERRVQPGRTVFTAICRPDVERVTLQSSRDVRTLAPSPTGHVVLAVYDGGFLDGAPNLTAHLRGDGTP